MADRGELKGGVATRSLIEKAIVITGQQKYCGNL
jgi:hypothetical protein